MTRLAALLLMGLLVTVSTSCGARPSFAHYEPSAAAEGVAGAALSGALEIEGPCVYVRRAEGRWLLVLPSDRATLEGQTLTFDDVRLTQGYEVRAGGSESGPSDDKVIPTRCDAGRIWLVADGDRALALAS